MKGKITQPTKTLSIEDARAYTKKLIGKLASDKEANFEQRLRDARQEAAKNGLTEEILDKLLVNR